jgi:hypothetical protein
VLTQGRARRPDNATQVIDLTAEVPKLFVVERILLMYENIHAKVPRGGIGAFLRNRTHE